MAVIVSSFVMLTQFLVSNSIKPTEKKTDLKNSEFGCKITNYHNTNNVLMTNDDKKLLC